MTAIGRPAPLPSSEERPVPRGSFDRLLPSHLPGERQSGPPAGGTWYARTRALTWATIQILDLLVPLVGLLVIVVGSNQHRMPNGLDDFLEIRFTLKNLLLVASFTAIWRGICVGVGLYDRARAGAVDETVRVLGVAATGTVLAAVFPLLSVSGTVQYRDLLPFWAFTALIMLLQRRALRAAVTGPRQEILIVGSGPRAAALYESLRLGARGAVNVLGFVDDEFPNCSEAIREQLLGRIADVEQILVSNQVDQVLITLPVRSRYSEAQAVIDVCSRIGVRAEYLADLFEHTRKRPRFEETSQFATIALPVVSEDQWKLFVKRAIDVTGAVVGLVLFAPLMLGVAVVIKVTSPGPVLFRQDRFGHRKRRFVMYKFRTMVVDAESRHCELEALNEATGPVFKLRNDPRVTRVGHVLRRTSIDELPQLVNVLCGHMSLVGPRPLPVRDVRKFTEAALMRRFSVRPGITGLWQVSGRSDLAFDEWMKLDLAYIDEWSLSLDMEVLVRTIPAVLLARGAS